MTHKNNDINTCMASLFIWMTTASQQAFGRRRASGILNLFATVKSDIHAYACTHIHGKSVQKRVCVHLMETFAGTRLQRFQVSETWMWGQGENGLGWDTVSGKKTPYLRTRIWATRKYHRSKGGLYLYLNRYLNSAFIYLSNRSCLVCFVDFCFYFFTPPYILDNGRVFNFTAFNIKLVTLPDKLWPCHS